MFPFICNRRFDVDLSLLTCAHCIFPHLSSPLTPRLPFFPLSVSLPSLLSLSPLSLSFPYRGGIGIKGVGPILLEELFTLPVGLDPELEAALEEFTAKKKAEEAKLRVLEEKAALGGVKGLAAQNEIKQIESADKTDERRIELTLNAAKKRASKQSGDSALQKKKAAEEAAEKEKRDAGRNKLKNMASLWEGK